MKYDLFKIREDFPMLQQQMNGKPFIYFDNAATTQKPASVIQAIVDYYAKGYGTVHRAVYEFATAATEAYCEVRSRLAKFINANSENEIIFTRGTTEGINLVAQSYGRRFVYRDDEIVITEMEHHANIVPWQLLCEEVGAKLIVVPVNQEGEIDLEEFQKRLSTRTKIVSVCHVSNVLGTINPIKEIADLTHRAGAVLVVDGAQAPARIPIDVKDLDADFYVFSGHKMYGPTGIGVLYGKANLLEIMPPYQGGGDMIKEVTFSKTVFQDAPLKFEAGTPPIAEVIGLGSALDYIEKLTVKAIHKHEENLLQHALSEFKQRENIQILGQATPRAPIISFHVKDVHPLDIGTMIAFKGIALRTGTLCASPILRHYGCGTVSRISFGLYNTQTEIDDFFQSLDALLPQLSSV